MSENQTRVSLTFFLGPRTERDREGLSASPDAAVRQLEAETMKLKVVSEEREQLLTELAKGKEDLAIAHTDLRESEGLLRAVNDHTSDVIFVKDREGRLVMVNPATARTIGKPADGEAGKTRRAVLRARGRPGPARSR